MTDSESRIQQDCFKWFWNTYCLPTAWTIQGHREIFLHVPNEGKANGRLVSVGLYPGASDLIFTWRGSIIFCEVKTPGGVISDDQLSFAAHVMEVGFDYHVVRSEEEFKNLIKELDS